MDLKTILQTNNVPLPSDFDERFQVLAQALRGDTRGLETFRGQRGGASETERIPIPIEKEDDDFLGPRLRWFVKVMGTPYAQGVVRILFAVLFFVSYLEKFPIIGNILSASLDIMTRGGMGLAKVIQNIIYGTFAAIPIPFASFVGLGISIAFAMIVYSLIALVSFSRQDFATAIESMLRITPGIGSMLGDLFLAGNSTFAKIDQRREDLVKDINAGIVTILSMFQGMTSGLETQANTFQQKLQNVATTIPPLPPSSMPTLPPMTDILERTTLPAVTPPMLPAVTPQQQGGRKQLSSRHHKLKKWKDYRLRRRTKRTQFGNIYESGLV